jgi:hypothetical protein
LRLPLAVLLVLSLAAGARAEDETATRVAGSVVRSKEWVVRRGKTREEEFVGDVRYDSAGTHFSSDWALYRQGPNEWSARGRIKARKDLPAGDVLETSGETAVYNETSLIGALEPARGGRIPLSRVPPEGGAPDRAEGDHLSWVGQTSGVLTGHARGWGPHGEFWADSARYDGGAAGRSLTLRGDRPVLHNFQGGDDAALKADRIVAFESPQRAVITGRAVGWVLTLSTSAPREGPVAERCGQGSRSVGPGPDARVSALLAPLESSRSAEEERRFWDAETAAFAARACPWGSRFDFWADRADYESTAEGRRVTLTGGRPVLRKIDEDSSGALKADRIVAIASTRRIQAEGRVKGWLVFKDEQELSAEAGGKKKPAKKGVKKAGEKAP